MDPRPESLLLVEDDEATRTFLADNLAADGFQVASATAPDEAIRAIEVRQPDLVVLDLILEGGSGLGVLDRVRAAEPGATRIDPDLPIVVLSAPASSPRPSCCATSGDTCRSAPRARSTRTPAACGGSWAAPAGRSC